MRRNRLALGRGSSGMRCARKETEMSDNQIREFIKSGWPFFGATSHGEVLARYIPYGPVFRWQQHRMIPTPLEGSDLLWWLQAADEDDHQG
jgi:hypothetical protein